MSQKNIFGKEKKSFTPRSNTQVIADIVKSHAHDVSLSTESAKLLGKAFLSTESLSAVEAEDLNAITNSQKTVIDGIVADYQESTGSTLTEDQVDNLSESIIIAQNPDEYYNAGAQTEPGTVVSAIGGGVDVGVVGQELTTESFEVHGMMNTLAMTVSYNIRPEKQSKAVELFFPTITLDSTQNNYTIDVHLSTVFNSKEYDLGGKGDAYRNQKHVIKALRKHDILKSNFTDIVPVFRKTISEDSFVDSTLLPPYVVRTDFDEDVQTSLLKIGKEIKLTHISQTDRMVTLGMSDDTDQISANPRLKTLGLKVGNDVVLFKNLQYHQQSTFTYSPNGDREGIQLMYDVNTHLVNADTIGEISQALPTELKALKDKKLEALLRFDISGRGNTDLGTVTLNAAAVQVRAVRNAETKEVLSMENADVKALVAELEKTSIVGYEVDATRTNSNLREHGLLLDDRVQRIIYGVKLHSPIAIRRPIDDKDTVSDSQRIDSLIRLSFIRRTNAGVSAIYDILNMLKSQPQQLDTAEPFNYTSVGVGQWFARTYVKDVELDVYKTCQSLTTSDRLNNVSSVMTNYILGEMTQAYCSSELAAGYELTDIGGSSFRPHVIAIADAFTSKFIFREGDARTLGDGFDFTIEECSDERLVLDEHGQAKDGEIGTIFLSFGKPRNGSLSVPLWFGNTLDKREIPRIVSRARGSKYQHETMVQPWFSHICHLPVLVRIKVTGLKRSIQERLNFQVTNEVIQPATAAAAAAVNGTPGA